MQKSSATRWNWSKETKRKHNSTSRRPCDRQFANVLRLAIPFQTNTWRVKTKIAKICANFSFDVFVCCLCAFMSLCDRYDATVLQRAPRTWIGSHFLFTIYHPSSIARVNSHDIVRTWYVFHTTISNCLPPWAVLILTKLVLALDDRLLVAFIAFVALLFFLTLQSGIIYTFHFWGKWWWESKRERKR